MLSIGSKALSKDLGFRVAGLALSSSEFVLLSEFGV